MLTLASADQWHCDNQWAEGAQLMHCACTQFNWENLEYSGLGPRRRSHPLARAVHGDDQGAYYYQTERKRAGRIAADRRAFRRSAGTIRILENWACSTKALAGAEQGAGPSLNDQGHWWCCCCALAAMGAARLVGLLCVGAAMIYAAKA